MDSIYLYLILLFLVVLSAFFSASETIFSCVNTLRLEKYQKKGKKGSGIALEMATNFEKTLSTILVGNNLVNIILTAIATAIFTEKYGIHGVLISTVVMTIVILFFGEFLPKNFGKKNPEMLSLKFAKPLKLFCIILHPITRFLIMFNKGISKVYDIEDDNPSVTEDELISIVEAIEEEGVLEEEESDLIRSAIEFDDHTINSIYTKKEEIFTINIDDNNSNILKNIIINHYSRVPVYKDKKDNIIGVLSEKDYLSEYLKNKEVNIRKIMRKPIIVRNNMKISNLLNLLKKKKEHLAIVKDTNDNLLGVVTMEDTIEYLVGEIYDEHDEIKEEA